MSKRFYQLDPCFLRTYNYTNEAPQFIQESEENGNSMVYYEYESFLNRGIRKLFCMLLRYTLCLLFNHYEQRTSLII